MAIVGREAPAEIVLANPEVSARHAEARILPDGRCELIDLSSTNGTFVNDCRIERCFISAHDRVRFGSAEVSGAALISATRQTANSAAASLAPVRAPGDVGSRTVQPRIAGPDYIPEVSPQAPVPAALPHQPPVQEVRRPVPVVQDRESSTAKSGRRREHEAGLGTELAVALAMQKSFTGKAFLTWFLYWILWFPGMIMNLVFLSEARRVARITGESPSGTGCLWLLIWTHLLFPLALLAFGLLFGLAVLDSFFNALFR